MNYLKPKISHHLIAGLVSTKTHSGHVQFRFHDKKSMANQEMLDELAFLCSHNHALHVGGFSGDC
jgi:hypothetical protein